MIRFVCPQVSLGGTGGLFVGGISGQITGEAGYVWTYARYKYNLPFLPAQYQTELKENIRQDCGVVVQ